MSDALLVLASDPAIQRALLSGLLGGGFAPTVSADPAELAAAAQRISPRLALLAGGPNDPAIQSALTALGASAQTAALPVVLLAPSPAPEPRFLRAFVSGVVEQLAGPFDPKRHPAELRELLASLELRPGRLQGKADKRELTLFLHALKLTQRSGALTVFGPQGELGQALYVRGALQSATAGGQTGQNALLQLLTAPLTHWTFAELSAGGGQATEVVIELGGDDDEELVLGEPIEIGDDEAEPIAGQPLDEGPRPRLLLVDDDPDLRKMFSLLLERRGFEVTTAVDGVEGGEKARDGQYAVVVADLSMPRLDGWGLLRQLRDDYRTRELPIAFLSCHDDYREQLRAFDSGAQAYLSKSVRHDALVQQIHALLGPREKVARDFAEGRTLGPLKLDELGAQWLLEALEGAGKTGLIVAKDGWASYSLFLERGEPVHAVAEAGVHTADGERAFNAFLASRRAEATFREGEPAPTRSLSGGRAALVARAVALLNENDRRAKESVMVGAKQIQVNDALYALYLQVAGANATEAARLLCEKKLPPGAVIAQMDASPLEVEELIRDLVRRGVVTLG